MIFSYLNSSLAYCTTIFFILFFIIYKWMTWTFDFGKNLGLKGPKPWPLFGNLFDYIKYGFHNCDMKYQKKYGHIYPAYVGRKPVLVVSDETILKQIFVKDAKSFIDRPDFGFSNLLKLNVAQLNGNDWERVRVLITPTFTPRKLKKMSPMIISSTNDMVNRFKKFENLDIDIRELFNSYAMDVIAKTMFGIDINVSNNTIHPFIKHLQKLFYTSLSNTSFILISIFPKLVSLFSDNILSQESETYMKNSVSKAIQCRKDSKEKYNDFLAIVLKANEELCGNNPDKIRNSDPVKYKGLSEDEILAQGIAFLFAGYETTSTLLTYNMFHLSLNPSAQDEVYNEIKNKFPFEKEITYDMLEDTHLVDQCISETLRICPPATRIQRMCAKDTTLTTPTGQVINIKKGMEFIIPIYAIHHDERIWSNPETFDIHRFDPSKKQLRNAFSFLPFGMGARNCVGMRFALLEAKFALIHLLRNFKIVSCDQTLQQITCDSLGLLKSKKPILIRLEKR